MTDSVLHKLDQVLNQLQTLQVSHQALQTKVRRTIDTSGIRMGGLIKCGWVAQVDSLTTNRNVPDSPASVSGIPRTDSPSLAVTSLPSAPGAPASHGPSEGSVPLTDKEREKNLYPSRVLLTSPLSHSSVFTLN